MHTTDDEEPEAYDKWSGLHNIYTIDGERGFYAGIQYQKQRDAEEIASLCTQLPEGMKGCTIIFKECPQGHGELTAANWVQHPCRMCEITSLYEQLRDTQKEASMLRWELTKAQASQIAKVDKP